MNAHVHDLEARVAGVEENLVGVHRRGDRSELRVARIERRLGLVDTH